jgi:hypothetical protein
LCVLDIKLTRHTAYPCLLLSPSHPWSPSLPLQAFPPSSRSVSLPAFPSLSLARSLARSLTISSLPPPSPSVSHSFALSISLSISLHKFSSSLHAYSPSACVPSHGQPYSCLEGPATRVFYYATHSHTLMQPIYKGGNKLKTDPASYRGAYFSSALAKLLEGILLHRLTQYTEAHDTLTANQLGTRPGRQIHDAIQHNWTKAESPTYVAFLDSSIAYPSVHSGRLAALLCQFDFLGKM